MERKKPHQRNLWEQQQSLRTYWLTPAQVSIDRKHKATSLPVSLPQRPTLWDGQETTLSVTSPALSDSPPAGIHAVPSTQEQPEAQTHSERKPVPIDPEVGEIPEDLRKLVTYVPLHLLSQEDRKQGLLPYVTTQFFIYSSDRFGYMPGIMLTDEETKERKPMNYGVTSNPTDIHAAYETIRSVIQTQEQVTEETHPEPEEITNPLLTVLSEDEIYIDPFELTADEAMEHGYPLLRRDVKSFRWWLEFSFDTRDDPKLYEALKKNNWKWGGYRKQWFNPNPYAKVPEGLSYGNAGFCYYSEERAERLEQRQEKAAAKATAHHDRADQMSSIIPFGQPMMPDHYSYRSDLSYRKKIWKQMDKFVEYYNKAEWLEHKAASSRRHQAHKENIFAMQNRLERLEADVRSIRRNYQSSIQQGDTTDLDHWRRCMTILAQEIVPLRRAIADAGGLPIEKVERELKPGDYIKIHGHAQYVVRVNRTTITCAHPTLKLYSGKPWETKYKKSDFQALLATAEEVAEASKKVEEQQPEENTE